MELLAYVKELLLLNDCVIIPGFGGFISNYQSAGVKHSYFTPPGKSVSFNKKLNFNDGLFVNHVADKEGTGYFTARKKVNLLVEELNYRLTDGEEIEIPAIGTLKLDEHENLIFTPRRVCNLNADAFGLTPFHYHPLSSKQVARRDRDAMQVIFSKRTLQKVFVAVPVLLALSVVPLKNNTGGLQRSDIMNFSTVMTVVAPQTPAETLVIAEAEEDTDGVEVTQEEDHRYFLIGGSFKEEENADSYISQMKAQGYQARNLGIIKGLNYVAIASYASFEEACSAQRDFLQKSPASGIWVYVQR